METNTARDASTTTSPPAGSSDINSENVMNTVSSSAGRWLQGWCRWRLAVTQEACSGSRGCEEAAEVREAGRRVVEELV